MIKPTPQVIRGLAMAVRQHPEVLEWLEDVLAQESKRLPWVLDHLAIVQGRCQIVTELIEFAKESPNLAAKLQ
jgi:flagellar biosynthesis/type III secretory pathway protein FliH